MYAALADPQEYLVHDIRFHRAIAAAVSARAMLTVAPGISLVEPGLVPANAVELRWSTFTDAADEAGMSRRYGGIHFIHADVQGRLIGRLVGAQAYKKAEAYWEGKKDR